MSESRVAKLYRLGRIVMLNDGPARSFYVPVTLPIRNDASAVAGFYR